MGQMVGNQASTVHKSSTGLSIAFPDVCKTPSAPGPVPIPYPNFAKTAVEAQKVKLQGGTVATKGAVLKSSTGNEAGAGTMMEVMQLKTKLNELHMQLQALPADDPNRWQAVLTDYAVMASALYITRRGQ